MTIIKLAPFCSLIIVLLHSGCSSRESERQAKTAELEKKYQAVEPLIKELRYDEAFALAGEICDEVTRDAPWARDLERRAIEDMKRIRELQKEGVVEFEGRRLRTSERDAIISQRERDKLEALTRAEQEKQREIEKVTRQKEMERQKREAEQKRLQEIKEHTVTAVALARQYDDNEVKGDLDFKNKWFYVEGRIEDIGKDLMGTSSYVLLEGYSFRRVQCVFDVKHEAVLAQLKKGERVLIKGTCTGLMSSVFMRNCEIIRKP